MNWLEISKAVFHLVLFMSPVVTIVIGIILFMQRWLGNRQDPRFFYLVWIAIMIRMLIPWSPSPAYSLWEHVPAIPLNNFIVTEKEMMMDPQGMDQQVFMQTEAITSEVYEMQWDWMTVAYVVWLIGVVGITIVFVVAYWKLRWSLHKQSVPIGAEDDNELQVCLDQCRKRLAIRSTNLSLRLTSLVSSPAAIGWLKPKILLPYDLIGKLDHRDWSCILMHELIHIRRMDALWNGLMTVFVALHWFNPFVWKAYFKMREDQELSCDAKLQKYVTPNQYGHTLLKLAESQIATNRYLTIAFISRNKNMTRRRVEMLFSKKKSVISLWFGMCIVLASTFLITYPKIFASSETNGEEVMFTAPVEGTITSRYGEETKYNMYAISIANEPGTAVHAVADGVIEKSGYDPGDGNHIVIVHASGYKSVYKHLNEMFVQEGQQVKQGELIGTIGSTGRSTGPHLSLEILQDGQFIDPETVIDFRD